MKDNLRQTTQEFKCLNWEAIYFTGKEALNTFG